MSFGAIDLDKNAEKGQSPSCRTDYEACPLVRPPSDNQKAIVARNIMEIPHLILLRPLAGRSTVSTAWPPRVIEQHRKYKYLDCHFGLYTCQRVRSNKAKPLTRTRHGRKWNSFIETEDEIIQRSLTFFGRWLLCAKSPALPRPGWSGAGRGGTGVCTRSSVSPRIIVINP